MRDDALKTCDRRGFGTWPRPMLRRVFRDMLNALFRPPLRPRSGRYLWAEVRDLTTYGSTSSRLLCLYLGLDPDQVVVPRMYRRSRK